LNDDLNLITRAILPLIWDPNTDQPTGSDFGIGDLNISFFFSPNTTSKITWGVGPVFLFPTSSEPKFAGDIGGRNLPGNKWAVGPTAVMVFTEGKWVVGGLVNHLWDYAGDPQRPTVNQSMIQPFMTYSLGNGWFLNSAPIVTVNWDASAGEQWVVPLGGLTSVGFLRFG
jgi:hypothetical protein